MLRNTFEQLESRLVLTVPYPLIITSDGTFDYNATSELMSVDAEPSTFILSATVGDFTSINSDPSDFHINVQVDQTGSLLGGVAGDDLEVMGSIDTTGDNEPDYSDVLLTGEICSFSFDPAATPNTYEFRFIPTGGELLNDFYVDVELGVSLTSADFSDDFSGNFSGSIPLMPPTSSLTLGSLAPSASIGDFVWQDSNGNGIQDGGEIGLAGVTVTLIGGGSNGVIGDADDTVKTMLSGLNGEYLFDGLMPCRQYQVVFSGLPSGFEFTDPNVDGNPAVDSDADPTTGSTPIVTLLPDEFNETVDAGVVESAGLGDFVWEDLNGNGLQDGGEVGVPGVTVTLTGGGANGVIGDGDDTTATVITGGNGEYEFVGLSPGVQYQVAFSNLPAGFQFTSANAGNDSTDSDANPANGQTPIVTLTSGTFNDSIDAGIVKPANIVGFVWEDLNGNGLQDGGDEDGVPGVTVTLTGGGANGVIGDGDDTTATANTNGVGEYQFNSLNPGEEYKLTFDLPAGFDFAPSEIGLDRTIDSDANTITGMTPIVILASAEVEETLDAGLVPIPSNPEIHIEKFTNGIDADLPGNATVIAAGDQITWTYEVTNTGDVAFTASDIDVVDDHGTPGDASDDFSTDNGGIVLVASSDVGGNGILSPGETWVFQATAIAESLNSTGGSGTFHLTGNSYTDGPDGNIRQYTTMGVTTNVSAFSRDEHGVWESSFLGAFSEGLGVTDSSEGDGGNGLHRVDSVGRQNYVLFEFSETVVIDRAYLNSVVNDSDLSVWIGTLNDPFNQHVALDDAILHSLEWNEDSNGNNSARWVDINGGQIAGNVLVLAASTIDTTPEDRFKIHKLEFQTLQSGIYKNIGTVTAGSASDADHSHYVNPQTTEPRIQIEKSTNGVDADTPAEAAEIAVGQQVTWTYQVTNTGNTVFTISDIDVVDDNGTPNDSSDDFSTDNGGIVLVASSDAGSNGILSPGETWVFQATAIAEELEAPASMGTFHLTGNSYTDGPDGNIRQYTTLGVTTNVSAFSRDEHGVWESSFLGAFSEGLGVTDSSEGDGGNGLHRVDSVGRQNYVLFEFSETVVIDRAYLNSVVNDSDLSVWIGTLNDPFNQHVALDDTTLHSLEWNEDSNGHNSARWVDINGGQLAGNVLVLAASTIDTTPEDRFKIHKLEFQVLEDAIYKNVGVVTAGSVSDEDHSHYVNVDAVPGIQIEKSTNGVDADQADQAAIIAAGEAVEWTYEVTNTGTSTFQQSEINVVDDNGTPADTADDFSISDGGITLLAATDVGGDGVLSPGETWTYEASAIAQQLTNPGLRGRVDMKGSAANDGPDGNLKSFTVAGVPFNVSAFSESNGSWNPAFVSTNGGGLGVTDAWEGNGSGVRSRLDNVGQHNYMVFAFAEPVIVDRALVTSIVSDSDMTVWIGTLNDPFNNHVSLNNNVLDSLQLQEANNAAGTSNRWAEFNAGSVAGNVLVIAPSIIDATPEDQFRIRVLGVQAIQHDTYRNVATVSAGGVSDTDTSQYINPEPLIPGIRIEKLTNGVDADTSSSAVRIAAGQSIVWTYEVTNTGTSTFQQNEINIVDDNGTPADSTDDFSLSNGGVSLLTATDIGSDGVLSPGETWTFEASGIAQQLFAPGVSGNVDMKGAAENDGPDGNIRNFTVAGVQTNVSAFSESGGTWNPAFLGINGGGLGVTDNSEGNGSGGRSRLDNVGQHNYMVFAFAKPVYVDRALVTSVVDDSDMTVWIGTLDDPFNNQVSLNAGVLNSLQIQEANNADGTTNRWANFNNGNVVGNVLVIAPSVNNSDGDDQFRIRKLRVQSTQAGIYGNLATVTTATVSDNDSSYYVNQRPSIQAAFSTVTPTDEQARMRFAATQSDVSPVVAEDVVFAVAGDSASNQTTADSGELAAIDTVFSDFGSSARRSRWA